jgi:hypothetical protein
MNGITEMVGDENCCYHLFGSNLLCANVSHPQCWTALGMMCGLVILETL